MKPSDIHSILTSTIPAGHNILLVGPPGAGKTDIVMSAARDCEADLILSHPVVEDPTDAKGLPYAVSKTEAAFLPYGQLLRAMKAEKLTVWFLDDLGQAAPAVQASYMQLLLAREINGKRIPDCITFVAATNRRQDKAGVNGILEPVKSRFKSILHMQIDYQDWCNWALKSGFITPTLIAFVRFKPDLLSQFAATADMTNSPSPRTVANMAHMEALHLPSALEHEAMSGAVGEGFATEYLAFRKMAASLISADVILTDPNGAALPKTPSEAYAISTALAARANDRTIARIGEYAARMAKANMGEFSALIIRDALRRDAKIANTQDYVKIMCGPIGQLISGNTVSA